MPFADWNMSAFEPQPQRVPQQPQQQPQMQNWLQGMGMGLPWSTNDPSQYNGPARDGSGPAPFGGGGLFGGGALDLGMGFNEMNRPDSRMKPNGNQFGELSNWPEPVQRGPYPQMSNWLEGMGMGLPQAPQPPQQRVDTFGQMFGNMGLQPRIDSFQQMFSNMGIGNAGMGYGQQPQPAPRRQGLFGGARNRGMSNYGTL